METRNGGEGIKGLWKEILESKYRSWQIVAES